MFNLTNLEINRFRTKIVFFCFIMFIFFAGFYVHSFKNNLNSDCDFSKYEYINKEMKCDSRLVIKKTGYEEFKRNLLEVIEENKTINNINDVSIYFRDLQNGPTLGIQEHELFTPASLLKVPLLMTYFNLRDSVPDLFDRELFFQKSNKFVSQNITPGKSIKLNNAYTINSLLEYMIKYSDNQAYFILFNYLYKISPNTDLLKETLVDLGVLYPKSFIEETLSVKSYSSIFVQLFHSSYFNKKETSEEILSLLTDVDWKNGLNAGVPEDIKISHKFGERNMEGMKQLHDCGIIYFPENPYLLCIMTRGNDFQKLSSFIGLVSKMFYEEIDSRKL